MCLRILFHFAEDLLSLLLKIINLSGVLRLYGLILPVVLLQYVLAALLLLQQVSHL